MRLRSIARAGLAAALVACGQGESSSEPAVEATAPPADAAPAPAKDLSALRGLVGRYPRDVQLFDGEPLHGRLVALLGERLPSFLANMGTQGPLGAEGDVLYVLGNKPHAGGDSQAILLIDLGQDLIHVRLLEETEMAELRERDVEIALPDEVKTTIANWEELARDAE